MAFLDIAGGLPRQAVERLRPLLAGNRRTLVVGGGAALAVAVAVAAVLHASGGGYSVLFAGLSGEDGGRTIAELVALPLTELAEVLRPTAELEDPGAAYLSPESGEATEVAVMIARDLCARIAVLADLGLGYLSLDRTTTTLSPGELQRLRLATQLRSGLLIPADVLFSGESAAIQNALRDVFNLGSIDRGIHRHGRRFDD